MPAAKTPGPAHALLSASGAKRWIACPPSARLVETFPDSTSDYAAEGTAAHALAEGLLKYYLKRISKNEYTVILNDTKKLCKQKGWCLSMIEHIEGYAARVMETYATARKEYPGALIFLEKRLDYSPYAPEGFGTGDVLILTPKKVRFRDLKYGKGRPVSSIDNEQLKVYGLGALVEYGFMFEFEELELIIDQPRLSEPDVFTISVDDLIDWGNNVMRPAALLAYEGKGEYNPSAEVCEWCRAKAKCKKYAEYNLELAKHEFQNPALLTDRAIGEILNRLDALTSWASAVKDHAFTEALKGKLWPGHKLIYGRADRYYNDVPAIINKLKRKGYDDDELYHPREIIGIGAMETLLSKRRFAELLDGLVTKPEGKPTLVPESKNGMLFVLQSNATDDFKKLKADDVDIFG